MNRRFFIAPDHSLAFNPKTGSSALVRAIIRTFYPDLEASTRVAVGNGRDPARRIYHWLCPEEPVPSRPAVMVVRDPVDRFRSAMVQTGLTDPGAVLGALESDERLLTPYNGRRPRLRTEPHFTAQADRSLGPTRCFRFEDLDRCARFLGLPLPLPVVNQAGGSKPPLTEEQRERVRSFYAADVALLNQVLPVDGISLMFEGLR